MARRLPTTNTVWVLACPSCQTNWGSVLGRGRWRGQGKGGLFGPLGRPQYEPLTRGKRWEVLPPARRLKRRIHCASCFVRWFDAGLQRDPNVVRAVSKANESGSLEDLRALRGYILGQVRRSIARSRWGRPPCPGCGEEPPTPAGSRRRYCSDACRARAYRRRTRRDKLLQLGAVAEATGLPRTLIRGASGAGELPCHKRGDRRYWRISEVEAWLNSKLLDDDSCPRIQ